MKRILTITFALITVLSFLACNKGGGGNKVSDSVPANNPSGGSKTSAFFDIFKTGTYHMKTKMVMTGMETISETWMKGDMMATTTDMAGTKMRVIMRDKKSHMINDDAKTVMVMPITESTNQQTVRTDVVLIGSGTANFDGRNLPYEEYSDSGRTVKIQYFIDGSKLAGMRNITKDMTVDIIYLALDQNVPNSVFEIPSNYQVMDMGSFSF